MIPATHGRPLAASPADDGIYSVLVVIKDVRSRSALVRQLEAAEFRVTVSSAFGLGDALHAHSFDVLVTTQSAGEMARFGLPQLARSFNPALPIVVLDSDVAGGEGLIGAVRDAVQRWPLRSRRPRRLH